MHQEKKGYLEVCPWKLHWLGEAYNRSALVCLPQVGLIAVTIKLRPSYEVLSIPETEYAVILLQCINVGTVLIPELFRPFSCNYLPLTLFSKS